MTKVLVLNQATYCPQYLTIDALSRTTWSHITHPDVTVYHYYGGYDSDDKPIRMFNMVPPKGEVIPELEDTGRQILVCGTGDSAQYRLEKLFMAYEYCFNNFEFDYIVRVCNTTYLHLRKLHKFLDELPRREKVYDGVRNKCAYRYQFCSGYFNYMSRDCLEQIVQHKEDFLNMPEEVNAEDVAAGVVLMDKLNYAYWDEPHVMVARPGVDSDGVTVEYSPDDICVAYRFAKEHIKQYIQLHNQVLKYEHV